MSAQSVNNAVERRTITLPKGGELTIDMTAEFLVRVRAHFDLADTVSPDNEQLRMFIFGAVKTAIDKEETK